jgi:hypothetical protein
LKATLAEKQDIVTEVTIRSSMEMAIGSMGGFWNPRRRRFGLVSSCQKTPHEQIATTPLREHGKWTRSKEAMKETASSN